MYLCKKSKRTEPKGRARDPKKSFRVFYKRLSFLVFFYIFCCYRTALIRHETCCAKSGLNSSKDSALPGSFFSEFSGWNRKKKIILQKVEPVLVNQPIEGRANRDRDLEPKAEHFLECCDDALDGQKKRWGVRETEL